MARRKVAGVKSDARNLRNRIFGDPDDPWDAATTAGQHVRDEGSVAKDSVAEQARIATDEIRADDRTPL